ncbi:MAG: phosphatidate cytidylyltransferase [Synergistaceae bacterium]|jgi:phosphatidate cytidylyltransferase|nr:phosphatidate cytidylyltransferase [Synergistaceae bacterium]
MGPRKTPQKTRIDRIKTDKFKDAPPIKGYDLFIRTASGIAIVTCIVGAIILGGVVWNIAASLIALRSLWELYGLLYTKYRLSRGWGITGGTLILLAISVGLSYAVTLSIMTMVAVLVLFTETVRRQMTGQSYALWNIGSTISGLVYVVLPWSFLILLRSHPLGKQYLLTIFLCTWSCDVGSYLAGTTFGESPLCDKVSPAKSWEGFWVGVIASIVCGSLLPVLFDLAPFPLVLLGALCGVAGQLGDLAESVLKREANVKDTGTLIPGHGGFLDRFDSILINATLTFFIIEVIG